MPHLSGMSHHIPSQCLVGAIIEFNAGQFMEIIKRYAAVHINGTVMECGAHGAGCGLRQIVFVANVAHELFGHVFQSHDAIGAAVFVDDHRKMNAAFAQHRQARQQL